jgi:outer membrane protein assembly factor BamB
MSVGDVDADGEVEIVGIVPSGLLGRVAIIEGDDCSMVTHEIPAYVGAPGASTLTTLVNLDDDPELELVTRYFRYNNTTPSPAGTANHLIAVNLDGTPLEAWPASGLSEPVTIEPVSGGVNVASSPIAIDLTGDGTPELLMPLYHRAPDAGQGLYRYGVVALNGRTGRVLWEYSGGSPAWGYNNTQSPAIADIDLDGDVEIIWNAAVLDHEGNLMFELPAAKFNPAATAPYQSVAVANLDSDPYPEIIAFSKVGVSLYSHTGEVQWHKPHPTNANIYPSMGITVAELDGDPLPEFLSTLVFPEGVTKALVAFDSDGEIIWDHRAAGFIDTQESGSSTPVAFDFDRDGLDELVQFRGASRGDAQPAGLYIFNGQTGEVIAHQLLTRQDRHVDEPLTVADVDGDGSAEILSNGRVSFGLSPIQIWDNLPGEPFPPAPAIRSGSYHQPVLTNEDGSLPTRIQPHWLIPGLNKVNAAVVVPDPATDVVDSFTYAANDGALSSASATVEITLAAANAPRIISSPPEAGSPNFEFEYGVLATDADAGDTLTYSLLSAPAGMSVDSNGLLNWSPGAGDLGSHTVELMVVDSQGNADRQQFVVNIVPATTMPDLSGMDDAAARSAIESAMLAVGNVADNYSLIVPPGQVLSQGLTAGSEVAAGTAVNFIVSLGPQPIFVPGLVGLDSAAAEGALLDTSLEVGTLSYENSDTAPRGSVLRQGLPVATEVLPGTQVDLVISGGPALQVSLQTHLLAPGEGMAVTLSAYAPDGSPQALPADIELAVIAEPDAQGQVPGFTATEVTTLSDTRGGYTLRVASASKGVEIDNLIVVHDNYAESGLQSAYGDFSTQLNAVNTVMRQLIDAAQRNDLAAVSSLGLQLRDLRDAIDLEALSYTPAVDVEDLFLPTTVPGLPSPADEALERRLEALAGRLRETNEFVSNLRPDNPRNDDLRNAFYTERLRQEMDRAALATYTPRGVIAQASTLYRILSLEIPQLLVADLNVVIGQLESQGLLVSDLEPEQFYQRVASATSGGRDAWLQEQPTDFTLVATMIASSIRAQLKAAIISKIIISVGRMTVNIVAEEHVRRVVPSAEIPGLVTGASASFHRFEMGHSIVEAISSGNLPEGHRIQLIGPELITKVGLQIAGILKTFDSRASMAKSIANLLKGAKAAYKLDSILEKEFKEIAPGQLMNGCVYSNDPNCVQLGVSEGLPDVYEIGNLPAPVLIVVYDVVGGNISVGNFAFFAKIVPVEHLP